MWYRDYRCKYWTMFKDYENNIQYGINDNKYWYEGEIITLKCSSEYLASEEEVEKALRKEAKRRGFVEGTKFLGCEGDQKNQELTIDKIKFHTEFQGLHCGNSWIFLRGEWGTVVNAISIESLPEVKLGVATVYPSVMEDIGNEVPYYLRGDLTWSGDKIEVKHSLESKTVQAVVGKLYFYHKSEEHGANFYELIREIQTKVDSIWKTFVIYKQLGSGLEFSREKEEFYSKFKQVYV